VKLIWHYLAADKEIVSSRTQENLKALEQEVLAIIHQIEAEIKQGRWDVRQTRLCEWCEYKPVCPAFKHPVAMEAVSPNVYLQDTGVQLVQKFSELQARKADYQAELMKLDEEQRQIEGALYAFAEKEGVVTVDGPNHRVFIKMEEEWKAPRKGEDPFAWELLRTTLKNAGKLEDVSTVNANMLKFAIKKGKWPEALVKSITGLVSQTVKKTVALVKK
jgi:putative RecB family exonuclease